MSENAVPLYPSRGIRGSHRELVANPTAFYHRIAQAHGLARFRIFHRYAYAVTDPAIAHEVLVTRRHNWGKGNVYRNLEQIVGRGLISLEGDEWRNDRKVIQPALHRSALLDLHEKANAACAAEMDGWGAESGYVPLVPRIRRITLQIIAESLLGSSLEAARSARLSESHLTASRLLLRKNWSPFQLREPWPTPLNILLRRHRTSITRFLESQVEKRVQEGAGTRGDLLDLMLAVEGAAEPPSMTRERLVDELLTIFSAGYDTTSAGLSWASFYLCQHPEIQEAARAEVERVVGDRPPTMDDLPQLQLVEHVFNEALRLRPPVHTILRVNREADQIAGYDIPAGSFMAISISAINRSPNFWMDPDAFQPERFGGEWDARAFIPFGSGNRRCIGALFAQLEGKIILANMVQRYAFSLDPQAQVFSAPSSGQSPENLRVRFRPIRSAQPA